MGRESVPIEMATYILRIQLHVKDAGAEFYFRQGYWPGSEKRSNHDRIANPEKKISNSLKIRWSRNYRILVS